MHGIIGKSRLVLGMIVGMTACLGSLRAQELMPFASDRALIAPNMFGNVLGTRPFLISGPGLGGIGGGGGTRTLSAILRDDVPSDASYLGLPAGTKLELLGKPKFLTFQGMKITPLDYASTVTIAAQNTLPIKEVATHTAEIQALLAKPGETAVFNAGSSQAQFSGITGIYHVFLVYDFVSGKTLLIVPNPTDGGLAGRNRISADSSPLPRDRFIFNYDFVASTALYSGAPNMNRYVFGFEKTFLDGWGSIEFRAPFASTVNSTSNADGSFGSGHGEFGNVFLVVKGLLHSTERIVISGGLGISIPTANDVRFNLGGADLLNIQNEAVILTPFLAALWTPSDRVFAQSWLGFGFDPTGNSVLTNLDGKGLTSVGKIYDPTTFQLDLQLGFWLIHPSTRDAGLRGLAPFVELHHNQQLQSQGGGASAGFTLTDSVGRLSETDLSTGAAMQFGDNLNLMGGFTFPLTGSRDRFSDWQFGVRLNYFFGPTGQARASLY